VILDSSAIVAILLREHGWEDLVAKLASEPTGVGAPTLAETGVVLTAKIGKKARTLLARFVQEAGLTIVPFGQEHWRAAIEAYASFGKGRHPAGLNFGDCLTYAVARLADQPLLFVGNDLSKTDLPAA
jgi:ribonuclease VapC